MTAFQAMPEVHPVAAVLYTHSTRATGELRSIHDRFSETLNAVDQDFVLLHEATMQPLLSATGGDVTAAVLLIRKERIILAVPWETQAGVELSPARQAMQVERDPIQAIIETWPFTIHGAVHLPTGVDLLQHVHDPHRSFMPVTDATITFQPSPLLSFKAPFLLINRRNIEVILDISQVDRHEEIDPDIDQPQVVDTALSGVRAAELLAATAVFKMVDLPRLQKVCVDQCESTLMSRKVVKAGAEVFHQGDLGDTMYVVEGGKLEVYVTNRSQVDHHLAFFGPGDFFGEMAIMGEGRRTATVRALADTSLMAVHEQAVQALMRQFPSATTNMLGIILQRQTGLDDVRGASSQRSH